MNNGVAMRWSNKITNGLAYLEKLNNSNDYATNNSNNTKNFLHVVLVKTTFHHTV